jgi:hypothetical protein
MRQNYSQRLEMQIPQENTYVGLANTRNMNQELENLSKDYILRKIDELKDYMKKDDRLIPYTLDYSPYQRVLPGQ